MRGFFALKSGKLVYGINCNRPADPREACGAKGWRGRKGRDGRAGNVVVTDRRGKELRYLTEHYHDLQGLRTAPAWAAFAALELWLGRLWPGHGAWIAWILTVSVGLLGVKWAVWAKGWYERRYGVVWTADEAEEDARFEMISLLHGEDEAMLGKRRSRYWRRRWIWMTVLLAFMLRALWLRGGQGAGGANWVPLTYLMGLVVGFFAAPVFLEGLEGDSPTLWRQGVYGAMLLVLLGGDLWYLTGGLRADWAFAMVGAVMLLVSLYDHWLFSRLLGGAGTRGGDDE